MGFDQKDVIIAEAKPIKAQESRVVVTNDENGARVIKKIDIE